MDLLRLSVVVDLCFQLRNLDIPVDSAIALNSMSNQQKNKAEQEQLKRLVLQNERRQGKDELQSE